VTSYSADHIWIEVDGDSAKLGVTDFARQALGSVVHVELPAIGTVLAHGQSFGTIESEKAISELYAPVSGEVTEANADPKGHWLVIVKLTKPDEIKSLLSAAQYADLVK